MLFRSFAAEAVGAETELVAVVVEIAARFRVPVENPTDQRGHWQFPTGTASSTTRRGREQTGVAEEGAVTWTSQIRLFGSHWQ